MGKLRPSRQREFNRYLERLARTGRTPALALGLNYRGRPILWKGIGYRDRERRWPVSPRTLFGVASITKSFTCVALMQLQEAGRLSVSDPVLKHLPEFRTPNPRWTRRIRLHHLMTHSSGLPPLPFLFQDLARSMLVDNSDKVWEYRRAGIDLTSPPIRTYADLLRALKETRYQLLGPPGKFFSYSNDGFALLGAVIEEASGERYERFLEDNLLRPAGLRSSSFDSGIVDRQSEVAQLYTTVRAGKRRRVVASPVWWEQAESRAAGGLRSNVEDLLSYAELYRTGGCIGNTRLLSEKSVRQMTRPHVRASPYVQYGYGLLVLPGFRGSPLIGHTGGLKGVSSVFLVLPNLALTGVALSNLDGFAIVSALLGGINAWLNLSPGKPLVELPRRGEPGRPLLRYVGLYGCGEGYWIDVRARSPHLIIDFRGIEITDHGLVARCVAPDLFAAGHLGRETLFQFHSDPRGRIRAVSMGFRHVRRRTKAEYLRARVGKIVW